MISYKLQCPNDHQFEGWFRSSGDFDEQGQSGHLSCPICGDGQISKAVMAPAIARRARLGVGEPAAPDIQDLEPEQKPVPARPEPKMPSPEMAAQIMGAMRKIKAHVEANFENVGKDFPEESRKIHYGEREKRDIFGKANVEEVRELIDEGIEIVPLPDLPDLDG